MISAGGQQADVAGFVIRMCQKVARMNRLGQLCQQQPQNKQQRYYFPTSHV